MHFLLLKNKELKLHPKFADIINDFQNFYDLSGYSLKEIDTFLWLAGKEHSPKKYRK